MKRVFIIRSAEARANCAKFAMSCTSEKVIQATFEEYKEDKTGEQRGFWHLLLRLFGDEVGYTLQEMKDIVKKEVLGTKVIAFSGKEYEVLASSESEKKIGYSNLIEQTYRMAAEAGVQLPPAHYKS